jgi:hypothetical protein
MSKKFFSYLTILSILLSLNISFAINTKDYAIIINLAGRQRMLTQKMSKEMLLIEADVEASKNKANLKNTTALFDKTLKGLRFGSKQLKLKKTKDARTQTLLSKVNKLWKLYFPITKSVSNGGKVPVTKIAAQNLPLLKNMNTAVRLYERSAKKETGISAGTVINLAGKQRMLTQKMSKEMLLIYLNHDKENNLLNLRKTSSLFDRTLLGLRDGDEDLGLPNTKEPHIVKQLNKVIGLWQEFKPVINTALSGVISKEDVELLAKLNLPLLKNMNTVVKMYEQR